MQKLRVEIDGEVVTSILRAAAQHISPLKTADDAPDLPFAVANGSCNFLHGAVRAEGNVKQNMSLRRQ
jgi:hypothetical protein